ncbi:CDP-alcohol phosphatidyltransferase family protein, partial [Streptomyces hirsutus]
MSTAILTGQPVPGSSIEADLRSLGFDVRIAPDTATAGALLAEVPAGQRVAVVDARFVGHEHALRLGLTDPRFPLAAIPGAVTAQPAPQPQWPHDRHRRPARALRPGPGRSAGS